jgi:hypothetical protein
MTALLIIVGAAVLAGGILVRRVLKNFGKM